MKTFRSVLFWTHLTAGLIAGLAIGIMSFTGVILAFEEEIVAWSERDARQVTAPEHPTPLPLAEVATNARAANGALAQATITVRNDPAAAIAFTIGRDDAYYANPYTGEIRQPESTAVHDFMHVMLAWHRFLGREGDSRPAGKLVNGICNLAFCALALTGLYLWWPRRWAWRSVRAVTLFNWRLAGKARDFNWHNVIGLWCSPVLIVLTLTAVPISFRWGGNLIYQMVGETPPARPVPPGAGSGGGRPSAAPSTAEAPEFDSSAILSLVEREYPRWTQISLRPGAGPRPGEARPPVTITIREAGSWPRTATTTLTVNPLSGDVVQRESFPDLSAGTQIRRWTRFLHTGQALGWGGQLVAGIASLGGLFLVYTGFALAWRRFVAFRRSRSNTATTPTEK